MGKTLADLREEKLEQKIQVLAAAGDWQGVLQALDAFDANSERRERAHRTGLDVTLADRAPRTGERFRPADLLRLSRREDWDDMIFSQRPEDLYQLVGERPISAMLRELTPVQQQVLFDNIVREVPVKDIAQAMGCSDRNITKHRQKALEKLRRSINQSS